MTSNWNVPRIKGWTIRLQNGETKSNTAWLQAKDICYVSPHTKTVGFGKHVFLSTQELAQQFSEAILTTIRRRHGDEATLLVEACDDKPKREFDDAIVLSRMQEKNFAPNKTPV